MKSKLICWSGDMWGKQFISGASTTSSRSANAFINRDISCFSRKSARFLTVNGYPTPTRYMRTYRKHKR